MGLQEAAGAWGATWRQGARGWRPWAITGGVAAAKRTATPAVNLATGERNITKQAGELEVLGRVPGGHLGPALEFSLEREPQEPTEQVKALWIAGPRSGLPPLQQVWAQGSPFGARRLERQLLKGQGPKT